MTVEGATVTTSLSNGSLIVNAKFPVTDATVPVSIAVKTEPGDVEYTYGDKFDPTGLVITVTNDDGTTLDVAYNDETKDKFSFAPAELTVATTEIAITYAEITEKVTIKVNPKDITGENVSYTFEPLIYTGEEQTPVAVVTIDGLTVTGTWSTVTNVGDTTTFTASGNFIGTIAEVDPGMKQSGTTFGDTLQTYLGETEEDTFTYGEIITVKVTPEATGTAAPMLFMAAPEANQMALFIEGVQITEAQDAVNGMELTFTIDTAEKQLAIGENTITAKYVGNSSMAGHEESVTVTLKQAPLTFTVDDKSAVTGAEMPEFTFTYGALAGSDTLTTEPTLSCEAANTDVPGTYDITASGAVITDGETDATGYYDISYTSGTLTVTKEYIRIDIGSLPELIYEEGDALDLSDLTIHAYYTETLYDVISYGDGMESSIENGTVLTEDFHNGEIITITYAGLTIELEPLQVEDSAFMDAWIASIRTLFSQQFRITASSNVGGRITPEGVTKVYYDRNQTYTITPDEGYVIADVLVDGESVGAISEYTFKRVKENHTITAVFEEIKWQNPFTDVNEADWFYEDVQFVSETGLMNGTAETKFSPDTALTRAMLVTVLWRLEGSPVLDYLMQFEDVPQDEWYTEAVCWAATNGIVLGYEDGMFYPDNSITREQLAAILYRYAVYKGMDNGVIFPMLPQYDYSLWAENDVIWAEAYGLLDGIGNDMTDMTADASRAEVAAMLRQFCEISG